ncbi:hypothetical protein [Streptomyces avicenniae]|uniref:hypothetical protein n=1 Tax=Streptomyces avicenniae TaxID=500153 RepID=UPI00069B0C25|nr:hypothetical protein [Streptomyces avicenniae]
MRAPYEHAVTSETPIFDALCAEYRRLFRSLPGDRSGEEHLAFVAFGSFHGAQHGHGPGSALAAYGYGYAGSLHAPAALVPAVLPSRQDPGAHAAPQGL